MSLFHVQLDYQGRLWLAAEDAVTQTVTWGSSTASLGHGGMHLTTEVNIGTDDQRGLVVALTKNPPSQPPHWQTVPSQLHATVLRIEDALRTAAQAVDAVLRRAGGAVRLPIYNFPRVPPNQIPNWTTVYWKFDEREREMLSPLLIHLEEKYQGAYQQGIAIPLPDAYEGRQLYLADTQVDSVRQALGRERPTTPACYTLYGVAWQNYENRSFAAAIVILTASLETALKWYLGQKGDEIVGYLLENIQSPPLTNLASSARNHACLPIPKRFQKWLADLTKARNEVVHRADGREPKPLEIARWFAVGEALLAAIDGVEGDPLVGALVSISPGIKDFSDGTRGVVLRREKTQGRDVFHVLLDNGVTRQFAPTAVKDLGDESV